MLRINMVYGYLPKILGIRNNITQNERENKKNNFHYICLFLIARILFKVTVGFSSCLRNRKQNHGRRTSLNVVASTTILIETNHVVTTRHAVPIEFVATFIIERL